MSIQVIINADDFGLTTGQNQAVQQAYQHGILDRASLLANGGAFEQAVEMGQGMPGLQVGIHLTLSEGMPLSPPRLLPTLSRPDGSFYPGTADLLRLWLQGRLDPAQARIEWQAQIEKALRAGVRLSHLDSHKHTHLLPPLLETALQLALDTNIAYVRLPLDLSALRRGPAGAVLWLLALRATSRLRSRGLKTSDHFVGVGDSGKMDASRLKAALQSARPGLTEIMMHPAVLTEEVAGLRGAYAWAARYRFNDELQALLTVDNPHRRRQ